MKNRAIEFIKAISNNDGNSCVNYKLYEYGSLIESISFSEVVDKFMKDFEEIKTFSESFNLDISKVFEMTCDIWKKHIVTF